MKLLVTIVLILKLTWQPFGEVHQIYHIYLKTIPFRQWWSVLKRYKHDILKQGYFGYLTPYFHWRWTKNKTKPRGLRGNNNANIKKVA